MEPTHIVPPQGHAVLGQDSGNLSSPPHQTPESLADNEEGPVEISHPAHPVEEASELGEVAVGELQMVVDTDRESEEGIPPLANAVDRGETLPGASAVEAEAVKDEGELPGALAEEERIVDELGSQNPPPSHQVHTATSETETGKESSFTEAPATDLSEYDADVTASSSAWAAKPPLPPSYGRVVSEGELDAEEMVRPWPLRHGQYSSTRSSRDGTNKARDVQVSLSAAQHSVFRTRNGVSQNYQGPVFVVEEKYVPCSGCGTPVDPVTRVPTVGGRDFFHPGCVTCFLCGCRSLTEVYISTPVGVVVCGKCESRGYTRCVRAELGAYAHASALHLLSSVNDYGSLAAKAQEVAEYMDDGMAYYEAAEAASMAEDDRTSAAATGHLHSWHSQYGIQGSARAMLLESEGRARPPRSASRQRAQPPSPLPSPGRPPRASSGRSSRQTAVASPARRAPTARLLPSLPAGNHFDNRVMTRKAMELVQRQRVFTIGDPNMNCIDVASWNERRQQR